MHANKVLAVLFVGIVLLVLAGCSTPVTAVYSCDGTVSHATAYYTDKGGTTQVEITLPWQTTVTLPPRSGEPQLRVEVPDEGKDINCNLSVSGDTGSSSQAGPEIIVVEATPES